MTHWKRNPDSPSPAVLVVDDDHNVLAAVSAALADHGYRVRTVENGAKALGLLLTEPFDAVVLDLVMPGMGGIAVVEELRRQGRQIPSVLMSGYLGTTDADRYRQMGISSTLRKPFHMEDLVGAVETAVQDKGKGVSCEQRH